MANNKIQGLAMVRALGMLIADSLRAPWSFIAAGTSPSGCCRRTGPPRRLGSPATIATWWPQLLAGVVYNLALAWPLLRRFLAENIPRGTLR